MITITSTGSFKNTENFFEKMRSEQIFSVLNTYGALGVKLLSEATPVDTGLTAQSWEYEVVKKRGSYTINWKNTNVISGIPVAILLQYGHGTGTGGWVEGYDFINPVIRPLFDEIANDVWEQVKRG